MHADGLGRLSETLGRYFVYSASYRASGVSEILRDACMCDVACTSAQIQIYGPGVGPVCDTDWILCEPEFRRADEGWQDYVTRVNAEIAKWLRDTLANTNWEQLVYDVGSLTPYPQAVADGADPRDWVVVEMFFASHTGPLNL